MARSFDASRPGLPGRVLMTSETVGDVWEYSLQLCSGLSRLGVEVALATVGPVLSADERKRISGLPNLQLFETPHSTESDGIWSDLGPSADWLMKLERKVNPDVVHINGLLHAALPWVSPTLLVAHRCMISWWMAVHGAKPRNWDIYRHRVALGLRNASMVVATTGAALCDLYTHYGPFPAGRVIPLGHDYPISSPSPKKRFIFTAAHYWDAANNVAILERVAPYLSWPVFMAGRHLVPDRTADRPKNICVLGALAERDWNEWLAQSSIYAMPASYPTCSYSVVQAAAAGCALVLGNHPSFKEIWGRAAHYVPSGDRDALRMALDRLTLDAHRCRDYAARAQERAAELRHSGMLSAYCKAYRDAIAVGTGAQQVLSEAVGA